MPEQKTNVPSAKNKFSFSLDYRVIIIVLLAVIAVMLIIWKPWQKSSSASDRTVTVTGEAVVKAEPDEFIFYPSYEFKNISKEASLAELTKKSDEIVSKLKSLGVADNKIKSNSTGYDQYNYFRNDDNTISYTLQLTVTVGTKDMAQKVQDYLVSTRPMGGVSPQASFSEAKRKELENQARDKATKDARAKADQSARNLGFKVGTVKSVEDGAGFNDIYPLMKGGDSAVSAASPTSLAVQPGENDLNYSVKVVYFVR